MKVFEVVTITLNTHKDTNICVSPTTHNKLQYDYVTISYDNYNCSIPVMCVIYYLLLRGMYTYCDV